MRLSAVLALGAAVASAEAALRALSGVSHAPGTAVATWALAGANATTAAAPHLGHHFSMAVAGLAGVSVERVNSTVRSCTGTALPCVKAPFFMETVIVNTEYAPRIAHALEMAAKDAAGLAAAFNPHVGRYNLSVSLHHAAGYMAARDLDTRKYNLEFGLYFGIGCAVIVALALFVYGKRLGAAAQQFFTRAAPATSTSKAAKEVPPA